MTNDKSDKSPQASTPPVVPEEQRVSGENIVTTLLKNPKEISDNIAARKDLLKSSAILLLVALASHAVFGLAVGLFGGMSVAIMDLVKVPLIALGALFLCFPSLYVFACVSGSPLSIPQTIALGCSSLALLGLLLVGLAPVVWLFSVSTDSLPFVAMLALLIWLIALSFAARYVGKLKANPLFQRQAGIRLWFVIFTLVTLQMTTCMRPILTESSRGWLTAEKKFFLSHFGSMFRGE
jgi:hypothetical protein